MADNDDRNDDSASQNFDYGSNVRLTDDPIPTDVPNDDIDPTHPNTDSNIDMTEVYDEGLSGAAEAEDPNARSMRDNS